MKKISGIKFISFDGDGTLWDFEKAMKTSLQKVLLELISIDSHVKSLLTIEKMIEFRDQVAEELKDKSSSLEEIRLESFKHTLKLVGRPDDNLASYLHQKYYKYRDEATELYPDILPTLEILKTRFSLGLLSNGNTYPEKCGLKDIFQFAIFSQDFGFEKPDARIFRAALEQARCNNQELLHVGDSINNDFFGARNANIKGIWLNRSHQRLSHLEIDPDFEIEDLSQLIDLIE